VSEEPSLPHLPRLRPQRVVVEGRYARLEPLDPLRHASELHDATFAPGADARLRFLSPVPEERSAFEAHLATLAAVDDPLFWAVIDRATGRCEGRQALLRVEPDHGVVEIGHILWGAAISRRRAATEAFALAAGYVFDDLGYRRLEWKCNADNAPSRRAAERFGFAFEGVFRQHMVMRGLSRDTAWFSLLDREWPARRAALAAWLDPGNFLADGTQRRPLERSRSG
jgi:RimJ/RimL family protein N-acetyltransferase